jgi:2,4-dienoyl-CoA reductase-like NADH-dependent reductase (Old Yellow Enzyme family)/thioredoxin reductase
MKQFSHLFSPKQIGRLNLKNRIIMAPIDTNLADEEGRVTDRLLAFYERRASGGAGMLIVENSQVDFPLGKNTDLQLSIHDDNKVVGLLKLSQIIHQQSALAAIQIHHAGRETTLEVTGGKIPVAPSDIPCGHLQTPVRELTIPEIEEIIHKFVEAAVRGKKAGFDLIEIHGAHGYLIGQFLSPYTNRRTDQYGNSFQGRIRFARNIVKGIKEALGKDFPISFRFSADEFIPGGITLDMGVKIAQALEQSGVDVLHVSAGIYESLPTLLEPMPYAQGWRCYLAAKAKKAVRIPVIAVGVIREPFFAEAVIAEGKADFVAIGRGLLADPDWPRKAEEGKVLEIRRCIGCNIGCLRERLTKAIQCSVNPETGMEQTYRKKTFKGKKKKITIVGGGPAGLEAARVAALRGFEVILYEKNDRLGGQMRFACLPPGKDKIAWTTEYYEHQMKILGVDVRLSQDVLFDRLLDRFADTLIIATGSSQKKPPVSGKWIPFVSAEDIFLSHELPNSGNVAVIGGGGIGCETAMYLQSMGMQVSIIEQLEDIALDVEPITAWDLKERIGKAGIEVFVNCKFKDFKKKILILKKEDEEIEKSKFDLIIWATGRTPNLGLVEEIEMHSFQGQVHVIGDAKSVGMIHDAIHDGYSVIQEIV